MQSDHDSMLACEHLGQQVHICLHCKQKLQQQRARNLIVADAGATDGQTLLND